MRHYGLAGTGATLAACLLSSPTIIITNSHVGGPATHGLWIIDLDSDSFAWQEYHPGIVFAPRFPYGLAVEPDAPL